MGFLRAVKLTPLQDGSGKWVTEEPLVFIDKHDKVHIVRDQFITDLASIPRLLWVIWPPFGRYTSSAVLHDFQCETDKLTRFDGDCLFLDAMKCDNVPLYKRWIIFLFVRCFGIYLAAKKLLWT
jgi:hypothetical protein